MPVRFAIPSQFQTERRPPSILRSLLDAILAVVFPTDCSLCGGELASDGCGRACGTCLASLSPWDGPTCSCCGLPFVSPRALDATDPRCGECLADTPDYAGVRSFGLYTGKLRQSILRVKFSSDERLAGYLGGLLTSAWDRLPGFQSTPSPLIVPVPLHVSRRKERGFNQAELIAEGLIRALAKRQSKTKTTNVKSCLVRRRATIPQTGLSVSARRENLRGAFEVQKPEQVRGREIVLVDDVMTTGATISACARALKRAGATRVWGLTVAHATPLFPDLTMRESDNPVDEFGTKSP